MPDTTPPLQSPRPGDPISASWGRGVTDRISRLDGQGSTGNMIADSTGVHHRSIPQPVTTMVRLARIVNEGPDDPNNPGTPIADWPDARYWVKRVVLASGRTDLTLPSAWIEDEGTDAMTAIFPHEIGMPGFPDGNHVLLNVPANIDAAHLWDPAKLYVDLYEAGYGLKWIALRFGAWVDYGVPVACLDANGCPDVNWGRFPGLPYIELADPPVCP